MLPGLTGSACFTLVLEKAGALDGRRRVLRVHAAGDGSLKALAVRGCFDAFTSLGWVHSAGDQGGDGGGVECVPFRRPRATPAGRQAPCPALRRSRVSRQRRRRTTGTFAGRGPPRSSVRPRRPGWRSRVRPRRVAVCPVVVSLLPCGSRNGSRTTPGSTGALQPHGRPALTGAAQAVQTLAGQVAHSGRSASAVGNVAKWAPRKLAVGSDQTSPGFLPTWWPARPRSLRLASPPLPLRARLARLGAPAPGGG